MEQLLRDLRAYTQASTSGLEPAEEVDANRILDKIVAQLQASIQDSGAVITRTALPLVRIHELQLEQVFQNLIGNAIKYHSPDRTPEIHVTARLQREGWKFTVTDNGIGIAPEYKETVFGLFKRLHTSDEYSGTGIGLAICQRIIDCIGGRIWVESDPGSGSTFFFTIPHTKT